VTLVKALVLDRPSLATPARPQQGRIVGADHDGTGAAPFGEAELRQRTGTTTACARHKEPTVLLDLAGRKDLARGTSRHRGARRIGTGPGARRTRF
jgi:hypothetical protein